MKRILVILLFAAQSLFATNYYVKNSGSDDSTGTSDTKAWATVSKVNSVTFSPGDTIFFKRGDHWHEQLEADNSGSGSSHVVYAAYGTGAKPKFDVSQDVPGWTSSGNWSDQGENVWRINMGVTSYGERLKLNGREYPNAYSTSHIDSYQRFYANHSGSNYLYVYATSNPASFYSSMSLDECDRGTSPYGCEISASYVTLLNLEFYGGQISVLVSGGNYNLIDSCKIGEFANNGLYAGTGTSASYWTVRNSIFDAADSTKHDFEYNHGNSDMMYLLGGTIEYWDIGYNEFKDCHHASITLGFTRKGCDSYTTGSVSYNKIHDNYIHWTPPTDYGRGLSVVACGTGHASYNEFYRNRIVGQSIPGQLGGDHNKFYYNVWDSCATPNWSGTSGDEAGGYTTQVGTALMFDDNAEGVINEDLEFVNNIFMNGASTAMRFGASSPRRISFINNIFYNNARAVPQVWPSQYHGLENIELYFVGELPSDANVVFKNNVVYNPNNSSPIIWNQWVDGTHRTVAWLESNIDHGGVASGNVASNPALTSERKIPTGSPAKDVGLNYAIGGAWDSKDYFGNSVPYNTTRDIGVHEYTPTGPYLHTKFVSNDGDDDYSGRMPDSAWQTIGKVNSYSFSAGDTISFNRGDTWEEELEIPSSGSSGNHIIVNAYGTGAKPIITAIDDLAGWNSSGNWTNIGSNRYTFSIGNSPGRMWFDGTEYGFAANATSVNSTNRFFWNGASTLTVYAISNPASAYSSVTCANPADARNALYLSGKHHLTFRNLDFRGGRICVSLTNADKMWFDSCAISWGTAQYGIAIGSASDSGVVSYCSVDKADYIFHTFEYGGLVAGSNGQDNIAFNSGSYWEIYGNYIAHMGHDGVNVAGGSGRPCNYNLVHDNEFYGGNDYSRAYETQDEANSTNCMHNLFYRNYVHGTTENIQVQGKYNYFYYNVIDTMSRSWKYTAVQSSGFYFQSYQSSDYNKVCNNLIMNCAGAGIVIGNKTAGETHNEISNNLIINCGLDPGYLDDQVTQANYWSFIIENGQVGSTIKNNTIYSGARTLTILYQGYFGSSNTLINVAALNAYNGSNGNTISGNIATNPSVGTDFKIGSSSSAKDAGVTVTLEGWNSKDYFGNAVPYNSVVDIGVHEYTASGILTVTTDCPVASGTVNAAYSENIAYATGGIPPYTWSEGNPALYGVDGLPSGLSISSAGMLTGTPTEAGTFTFTIKVTDDEVTSNVKTCSITINSATSSPRALILLR